MWQQLRSFTALLLGTFLMMVGTGLGNVVVPLRASAEGWSSTAIAWIGTAYAVAFTAGCILTPLFVRRVGHIRVFAVLQTLLAASLLLLALVPHPVAWGFFRALGGVTLVGGYMVIESWLNERVDNASRGTVFAAYMIVSMSGVAVGQFILPLGDITKETLFMVGALAFGAALLPVALSVAPSPQPLTRVTINARALFRKSPAAVVGSFLAGVIFGNWIYFGPLYGKAAGLTETGIATMLTAAMVGGVVFQVPFGWLSDRIDRRYVMALAGAIGAAISACMVIVAPIDPFTIVAGVFALGSVLFTIYALNVAHANDQASADEFLQVSGGLLIVYGIGNMVGPQLGGRLMDEIGPDGFFVAMGGVYALYGLYALWRSMRSPALPPTERADFRIMPALPAQTPESLALDARTTEAASTTASDGATGTDPVSRTRSHRRTDMTDKQRDATGYASPPCFMHELDPSYSGITPGDAQTAIDVARWRKSQRERLIAERLAVTADARAEAARRIADRLDAEIGTVEGSVVGIYWPFRGEPDLREWASSVAARGGQLALPVVLEKGKPLEFRTWSPGEKLEKGVWNIPVPAGGAAALPDIVVAPVVGYDEAGFRLGYGGGFYDRTLAAMPSRPLTFGVGYALARLQTIYPQWHDIPLDRMVIDQEVNSSG